MIRSCLFLLFFIGACGEAPDPAEPSPDVGSVLDSGPQDTGSPLNDSGTPSPDAGSGTPDTGPILDSGRPQPDGGAGSLNLLFQSGFGGSTAIETVSNAHDRLIGLDDDLPSPNDWRSDFVTNNPYWGTARIYYEDNEGDRQKRYAEIHPDGYLRFVLRDSHISIPNPHRPDAGPQRKGRIQLAVNQLEGLDAFTYQVKLKLTGGFANLAFEPAPITWMTLAEIWNDASASQTSARIHVAINKDRQEGFVWQVTGQEKRREGNGFSWVDIPGFKFPPENQLRRGYIVAIDEWLVLTVRARDGIEDGRFQATIGRPGDRAEVIADWEGATRHREGPGGGFDAIQFMKVYTNGLLLDRMAQEVPRPPALEIHWDDFKVWAGAEF